MAQKLTKEQAKKFLLIKHGLYGDYKFSGKRGIRDFVQQSGCIQYDPIDVCGKNHELVLQSRIEGFRKEMLHELLYKDRVLVDWFDKNQAIMSMEDWPYFEHERKRIVHNSRHKEEVDKVSDEIYEYIKQNGQVCSSDLQDHQKKLDWWWAPTSLARLALETMYMRGEIAISDKKNTRRFYDIAGRVIPQNILDAPNPNGTQDDIHRWNVLRRIRSVGMLHNKASDAFLGFHHFKSKDRNVAFGRLLADGAIFELEVEGSAAPFYVDATDMEMLELAIDTKDENPRLEFIAPLDNMIWDRNIIEELFDFSYKWEIYTPVKDRKYGYYVLPVLWGDDFIARIELKRDRKKKRIEKIGLWWEDKAYNTPEMRKKIRDKLKEFNKVMY